MDVVLSKAVLQIVVTPTAGGNAKFQSVLVSGVIDDTLDSTGCQFTHGEVFKVVGGAANQTVINLHSKSVAGLEKYKKSFTGLLASLAELGQSITYTATISSGFRKYLPSNKPQYQSRDNVEPKLFSNKRVLDQEVYNGALGLASTQIETTTNRFTDFHVHKQKAPENHINSNAISKAADVEARYFQYGDHKKAATVDKEAQGIATTVKDFRDPANRFENDIVHFGSIDPNAGPGVTAGVSAKNQPHEIDRFDAPKNHFGQLNPNSGPGLVAGVSAKNQPHEIDRFDSPKKHHGTLNPFNVDPAKVAGVTAIQQPHEIDRFDSPRQHFRQVNPNSGPGVIAGVQSVGQPHEIDRFDNPVQHHGQLDPLVGTDPIAGVTKEKQPHEVDRFHENKQRLMAQPNIGDDFAGTPAKKQVREPVGRFDGVGSPSANNMLSPSGRVRQPPGGLSTFTFG